MTRYSFVVSARMPLTAIKCPTQPSPATCEAWFAHSKSKLFEFDFRFAFILLSRTGLSGRFGRGFS
jgi:hypothetical protein